MANGQSRILTHEQHEQGTPNIRALILPQRSCVVQCCSDHDDTWHGSPVLENPGAELRTATPRRDGPSRSLPDPSARHFHERSYACFLPLSGALELGYEDFDQLRADPDLAVLRQDERFEVSASSVTHASRTSAMP